MGCETRDGAPRSLQEKLRATANYALELSRFKTVRVSGRYSGHEERPQLMTSLPDFLSRCEPLDGKAVERRAFGYCESDLTQGVFRRGLKQLPEDLIITKASE